MYPHCPRTTKYVQAYFNRFGFGIKTVTKHYLCIAAECLCVSPAVLLVVLPGFPPDLKCGLWDYVPNENAVLVRLLKMQGLGSTVVKALWSCVKGSRVRSRRPAVLAVVAFIYEKREVPCAVTHESWHLAYKISAVIGAIETIHIQSVGNGRWVLPYTLTLTFYEVPYVFWALTHKILLFASTITNHTQTNL